MCAAYLVNEKNQNCHQTHSSPNMATFAEYARQSCLGSTTNSAKYSAWCRAAGGWLSVVGTLPVGLVGGAVYSPAPWDAHILKQMATTQSHRHQPGSHCSVVCRFSTHQPSYSLLALQRWLPGCMPLPLYSTIKSMVQPFCALIDDTPHGSVVSKILNVRHVKHEKSFNM
ncbi:hypothetical protein PVAP13_7NG284424 [Panicum virgatum]|uniref:Uncharacterized protein n=1 Tax=Panicum virgatum TaxID=38727 RepID=A0A8T0PZK6_PANVG|nr:hypothetical protein PVAP13_7NG284424 [Panicum virgatum]